MSQVYDNSPNDSTFSQNNDIPAINSNDPEKRELLNTLKIISAKYREMKH